MRKTLLFAIFVVQALSGFSQKSTAVQNRELKKREDSLKNYALTIVQGISPEARLKADSVFTRMFVRALQVKNSISYPFDSLVTISRLSPRDSSFRIYTWQLMMSEDQVRQRGAIQMKTADGSLKLFPLIDVSDFIVKPQDTITNNTAWMGALYYQIIEKKAQGKPVYTLLGYDENNLSSNKKIIEILTFKDGAPIFGDRIFSIKNDGQQSPSISRYIMEYKKHAGPRLVYDPDQDMIVMEHLISETGEPEKRYTYVGDGDYEGLKWSGDRWVYVSKVFNLVTPEGREPVPSPLRDAKGNIDESKLSNRLPDYMQEDSLPPVALPKKSKSARKKDN